jgi:hypothetical protein
MFTKYYENNQQMAVLDEGTEIMAEETQKEGEGMCQSYIDIWPQRQMCNKNK